MVPISEEVYIYDDIMKIDPKYLPLPTFCFNPCSPFTLGVAKKTEGDWSHFMWMTAPGVFASQSWWFMTKSIDDYRNYTMKFIYNPSWTATQRKAILDSLLLDLAKPKWETRYDVLALLGHLVGLRWLQSKRFEICSDSADHIKHADNRYDLKDPDPSEVNAWMKFHRWSADNPNGYLVLARYFGRD